MVYNKNKKAGMELSLNLIIMLIIGMVVLGLVIGFVTGLVDKQKEGFENQIGDNEKLKLEEVRDCSNALCLSPSPSLTVKKKKTTNLFIGVRATADDIECGGGPLVCDTINTTITDSNGKDAPKALAIKGPGLNAKAGGSVAQMYTIEATSESKVGMVYYVQFEIYPSSETASHVETLTVTVE